MHGAGFYNDLQLDHNDVPIMSFVTTSKFLKLVICDDVLCTSSKIITLDRSQGRNVLYLDEDAKYVKIVYEGYIMGRRSFGPLQLATVFLNVSQSCGATYSPAPALSDVPTYPSESPSLPPSFTPTTDPANGPVIAYVMDVIVPTLEESVSKKKYVLTAW